MSDQLAKYELDIHNNILLIYNSTGKNVTILPHKSRFQKIWATWITTIVYHLDN